MLETSHPPNYYIPPEDVSTALLVESPRRSMCEWKGQAGYCHLCVDGVTVRDAAWFYPDPVNDFSVIRDHVSFYPQLVQEEESGFGDQWEKLCLRGRMIDPARFYEQVSQFSDEIESTWGASAFQSLVARRGA